MPYQKFLFGDYSVSHHFLFVKRFLLVFVTFFVFLLFLRFFVISASLLFFRLGIFYSFSFYFCFDHFCLSPILHPLCDFSHYLSVFLFSRFGYNKDQKLPRGEAKNIDKLKWPYGGFIREARIQHHMTVDHLAERIDRSSSLVQSIENGTRRPGNETLFRLCEVLSLSADAFLRPEITRKDFLYMNLTQRLAACDEATLVRMSGFLHILLSDPVIPDFPAIPAPEPGEEE